MTIKWKCILHINVNTKINQIHSHPLHAISQKHTKDLVVSWQSSGFRKRKELDYSPFFLLFSSSIYVWIKRLLRFAAHLKEGEGSNASSFIHIWKGGVTKAQTFTEKMQVPISQITPCPWPEVEIMLNRIEVCMLVMSVFLLSLVVDRSLNSAGTV